MMVALVLGSVGNVGRVKPGDIMGRVSHGTHVMVGEGDGEKRPLSWEYLLAGTFGGWLSQTGHAEKSGTT